MIDRKILCLAALLSTPSFATAQSLQTIYDGAYRSTALDLALDGTKLWVASSWGIELYDVTTSPPRLVAARPVRGATSCVEIGPSRLYVGSGRAIHALSRDGGGEVLGSVSTTGTINDLLLVEPYLYAATSEGVVQFDLLDPDEPQPVRALSTSTGFALRLARAGSWLYAADGDASVEVYSIEIPSVPQRIGSFGSMPRTVAVSEASGNLYVSDGQRTEIWSGLGAALSRVGVIEAGGTVALPEDDGFVWLAGHDRRLRAYDVASTSGPVKLFASKATQVGGNVNGYSSAVADGTRLYLAAGDAGLQTWETAGFGEPYLLRGYATPTGASLKAFSGGVVAARDAGGLLRYSVSGSGNLTETASWDTSSMSIIFDANESTLLVASGSRLRRFDLTTSPPVESGTVNLAGSVRSAALSREGAIAITSSQTVFAVDFAAGSAAQVDLGGMQPLFVTADGDDLAFAAFGEDGTTSVSFYANGDLSASPVSAVVDGAATSGIALSSQRVACFTFRGINIADFSAGGATSVIAGSSVGIATDVDLSGRTMLLLIGSALQEWDIVSGVRLRDVPLESGATATSFVGGEAQAVVATSRGLSVFQLANGSTPPTEVSPESVANRYYREAMLGDRTLHLFDGRDVTTFALGTGDLPGPGRVLSTDTPATAVAVVGEIVYLLTPEGRLSGLTTSGIEVASYVVEESDDQRILSMISVGSTLWVSVEVNCLSGGCEFRTLVIDPATGLVKTSTLPGRAVAATMEGSTIYAIFSVPDEIRVIDAADPRHPNITKGVASTGAPISIARDPSRQTVYVLGDRLYAYNDDLAPIGELLEPYEPDPTGRVSYIGQQVHVIGNMGVITARTLEPQVYEIGSPAAWFPRPAPGSRAAAVISSAKRGEKLYLLSDYSLEIWSTMPPEVPRRRPVR